jgi:hypothetical protein
MTKQKKKIFTTSPIPDPQSTMDIGTVLNTHVNNILKDVAPGSIILEGKISKNKLQKPR